MGLPLSAWDSLTIGMVNNYICAYNRRKRRARGETVREPDEQYRILKAMEPEVDAKFAAGEIRPEKYESYKKSLQKWEEMAEDGG